MDVQSLGTITSSASMVYKTLGNSLLQPLNQHVRRCCNFSFVSNPIDLFGVRFESENLLSIIVKASGLSVSESDSHTGKLVEIVTRFSNFQSRTTCVRGLVLNKKTEKSPFAAKEQESKLVTRFKGIERRSTARES